MGRACWRALVLTAFLSVNATGCAGEGGDDGMTDRGSARGSGIRSPVVAGAFYPGDAATLAGDIDEYLAEAETPSFDGDIVALIAPHAGYIYSGAVAAHAYAAVRGRKYESVVVVAPSHRFGFRGASVHGGTGYETPLGVVPIDRDIADAISAGSELYRYVPQAHAQEHSLEVQVPFLQRALGDFAIVPIIMGDQGESNVRALARRIVDAVRGAGAKRVLLVASTDLSHYHGYDAAVALDARVIEYVSEFDPEGLLRALAAGECEACGGGPAAAVMTAARELGSDRSVVVKYANSGDVTGDRAQVVGYLSAVLSRPAPAGEGDPVDDRSKGAPGAERPYEGLTAADRAALLGLARGAIEAAVKGNPAPVLDAPSDALSTACGAFVTINRDGQLRGCIGYIEAARPLHETVGLMAVEAALRDPRFHPVEPSELPELQIEISVLSPLDVVDDPSSIVVGRDGLIVQSGRSRGLLLPQVAAEYGWDRETFLERTCRKAGLPPDAWRREDVVILRFTAEVFGEGDGGDSGGTAGGRG